MPLTRGAIALVNPLLSNDLVLNWWFRIYSAILRASYRRSAERASPIERLALQADDAGPDRFNFTLRAWVGDRLRNFPRWGRGHLIYGELSLSLRDTRAAYASAHAVLTIAGKGDWQGRHLLARSYLAAKRGEEARELLRELVLEKDAGLAVKEDLAASMMLCGDRHGALTVFSEIPEGSLSLEGASARDALRRELAP